jgi:hypothetical protein
MGLTALDLNGTVAKNKSNSDSTQIMTRRAYRSFTMSDVEQKNIRELVGKVGGEVARTWAQPNRGDEG